ncbi:MAG TPA: hypothetical protein VKZ97_06315 [Flavobacteriaceae bacterium]|nr:hypothetical protein [Flavobacteriaceae bacterium]
MKLTISFILFLLAISNSFSQQQSYVYIDQDGLEINKEEFTNKLTNKDSMFTNWHSIGKNGYCYASLKKNLYLTGIYDYNEIKLHLKNSGITIEKDAILLLQYKFKDDLCTNYWDNNWKHKEIIELKKHTTSIQKKLKKDNIYYIIFFEDGIELHNSPKNKNEYYFSDSKNYFRKLLFTSPTLCGSFALIKPNGETLIRNGEYRADFMAQHLKPVNWEIFFKN